MKKKSPMQKVPKNHSPDKRPEARHKRPRSVRARPWSWWWWPLFLVLNGSTLDLWLHSAGQGAAGAAAIH